MYHRAVSPIEMYSVGRNQLNFYTGVVSFIRMKLLSNIEPFSHWKNEFEKALRSIVEALSRLQLQIEHYKITYSFYLLILLIEFSCQKKPARTT